MRHAGGRFTRSRIRCARAWAHGAAQLKRHGVPSLASSSTPPRLRRGHRSEAGDRVSPSVALLLAALVLAVINAAVRPIMVLLTMSPFPCCSLGLFLLVLNGVCLWLVTVAGAGCRGGSCRRPSRASTTMRMSAGSCRCGDGGPRVSAMAPRPLVAVPANPDDDFRCCRPAA